MNFWRICGLIVSCLIAFGTSRDFYPRKKIQIRREPQFRHCFNAGGCKVISVTFSKLFPRAATILFLRSRGYSITLGENIKGSLPHPGTALLSPSACTRVKSYLQLSTKYTIISFEGFACRLLHYHRIYSSGHADNCWPGHYYKTRSGVVAKAFFLG